MSSSRQEYEHKVHILKSYIDKFPENLSNLSDGQDERIQQEMEEWCQGRLEALMTTDAVLKETLWKLNISEKPSNLNLIHEGRMCHLYSHFDVLFCNNMSWFLLLTSVIRILKFLILV